MWIGLEVYEPLANGYYQKSLHKSLLLSLPELSQQLFILFLKHAILTAKVILPLSRCMFQSQNWGQGEYYITGNLLLIFMVMQLAPVYPIHEMQDLW